MDIYIIVQNRHHKGCSESVRNERCDPWEGCVRETIAVRETIETRGCVARRETDVRLDERA